MNNELIVYVLMGLVILVSLVACIWTIYLGNHIRKEKDDEVSRAKIKNAVLKNPIYISYIVFPTLILLISAILIVMFMQ